jgi:hypothetical protein
LPEQRTTAHNAIVSDEPTVLPMGHYCEGHPGHRAIGKEGRAMRIDVDDSTADTPVIVWGIPNIAKLINRSPRWTLNALHAGLLSGCRKVAGRWSAEPTRLLSDWRR